MRENNIEESIKRPIADLLIDEVEEGSLGFHSAEYTETINGLLPRLVARFLCDADKIPTELEDVNLNLRIRDSEWRIKANVDDMKFEINTLTIFFSLAPKDFYYVSQSDKFNSIRLAIESLYFSDIINPELLDDRLVELNQVGITNHRFCNILLSSLGSPSVFAYTLNELNINELDSNGNNFKIIDPTKDSYNIEERRKRYVQQDLLVSQPTYTSLESRNGISSTNLLEWGGIKINFNNDYQDYLSNLVDNSIFQKNLKLTLRLTSQSNLNIKSGDIVQISLPNLDTERYLVMDRLFIIGSEIKFNYGLRALDS